MVCSKPKTRRFIAASLFLLIAILFSAFEVQAAAAQVPGFTLPAVPGNEVIDIRDFRGKVVLVNFWATWCGPCIQEIPSLNSLQEKFAGQGFSIIGISLDRGGPAIVEKMINRAGIKYPILLGNTKVSKEFGGIFGVPTSFLLDRSGKVLKKYTGYVTHSVFENDIGQIIN